MNDGRLLPTWIDLMVWAVLLGERELARHLWARTAQPLRSALMAARLSRQIVAKLQQSSVNSLADEMKADKEERVKVYVFRKAAAGR